MCHSAGRRTVLPVFPPDRTCKQRTRNGLSSVAPPAGYSTEPDRLQFLLERRFPGPLALLGDPVNVSDPRLDIEAKSGEIGEKFVNQIVGVFGDPLVIELCHAAVRSRVVVRFADRHRIHAGRAAKMMTTAHDGHSFSPCPNTRHNFALLLDNFLPP